MKNANANMHYPFWLGGVGASMAACCTHPLDLIKVRMQTQAASGAKPASTIAVLRSTVAHTGIRSLYTGISASILRQMTYSMVRLGSYDEIKLYLARLHGRTSALHLPIAAGIAGGLGGIVGNPADILLVRMTTDSVRPVAERFGYTNALTGLITLIRTEGLDGLLRGVSANTTRAILMNVSQVGSYDLIKSTLLHRHLFGTAYVLRDNIILHSISSTLAGLIATTICAPFDVIKSRVMHASEKASPIEILTTSLKQEGPRFLFKGWTPAFVRLGPNTVLMFIFLEQLRKLWSYTHSL